MIIPRLDHFPVAGEQVPRFEGFHVYMRIQAMWISEVKSNLFCTVSGPQDQIGTTRRFADFGIWAEPL